MMEVVSLEQRNASSHKIGLEMRRALQQHPSSVSTERAQRRRLNNPPQRNTTSNNQLAEDSLNLEQEIDACQNCWRVEVSPNEDLPPLLLSQCNVPFSSHSRTFCTTTFSGLVRDDEGQVSLLLCEQCKVCLTASSKSVTSASKWPSFVYLLLVNPTSTVSFVERWRCVPELWRLWWRHEFQSVLTVPEPEPYFIDVTAKQSQTMKSIKELRWVDLEKTIDDHTSLPFVYCPWGCDEFLHKSRIEIPYDIIVGFCIKFCHDQFEHKTPKQYSAPRYQKCTKGMRRDFLTNTYLLSNKQWAKERSLVRTSEGPKLLSCRYHGIGTVEQFVHIPRNPFGNVASSETDQLTPAVVRPRTIRKAQARAYSNNYQMNQVRICYSGMDTLSLQRYGRFDKASLLSDNRDSLAIAGRRDMADFVEIVKEENVHPQSFIEGRQDLSRTLAATLGEVEKVHCKGATFVTFEDSVRLDNMWKNAPGKVIQVADTEGNMSEQHYVPSWPPTITYVHPAACDWGATPPSIPWMNVVGCDTRATWMTVAAASLVVPVWEALAASVTHSNDTAGYILAYAVSHCFPHIRNTMRQSSNLFKLLSAKDLNNLICSNNAFSPPSIADFFSDVNGILVRSDTIMMTENYLGCHTIICYRREGQPGSMDNHSHLFVDNNGSPWDARLILCSQAGQPGRSRRQGSGTAEQGERHYSKWTGQAYMRHGYPSFPQWYMASRGQSSSQKRIHELPLPHVAETWDIVVYVRKQQTDMAVVTEQYLNSMGGQSKVYCAMHNKPLITNGLRDRECKYTMNEQTIGCCAESAAYICPIRSCRVGCCKTHSLFDQDQQGDRLFIHHTLPSQVLCGTTYVIHNTEEESDFDDSSIESTTEHTIALSIDTDLQEWFDLDTCYEDSYAGSSTSKDKASDMTNVGADRTEFQTNQYDDDGMSIEQLHCDVIAQLSSTSGYSASSNHSSSLNGTADQPLSPESELPRQQGGNHILHTAVECDPCRDDIAKSSMQQWDTDLYITDLFGETNNSDNDYDNQSHETPNTDDLSTEESFTAPQMPFEDRNLEVPTTPEGQEPFCPVVPNDYIGCHVLLNKFGKLLVRKESTLKGNKFERCFLQRIVATCTSLSTIPLLYFEAMLFPSIFWKDTPDGAIVGSLPSAFLTSDKHLRKHGIASLGNHFRTRLTDSSLLTAADAKYQFLAFDALNNLNLRNTDTRMIANRGFAQRQGRGGIKASDLNKTVFESESIDSKAIVMKLGAAVSQFEHVYFWTHTCSHKTHLGTRIIRAWMDSEEYKSTLLLPGETSITPNELQHRIQDANSSAMTLILRSYIENVLLWVTYITKSPEQPIGPILKSWFRFELQDLTGNLPHIHGLLCAKEKRTDGETMHRMLDRIRGILQELVRPEEISQYVNSGIVASEEELSDRVNMVGRFIQHTCNNRCQVPCFGQDLYATAAERILYRCKVPNNARLNPNPNCHTFVEVPTNHSPTAVNVMEALGVVNLDQDGTVNYLERTLAPLRHCPPARAEEGVISPVLANLVIRNPNQGNAQYLTSYGTNRYITKYVSQVDKNNKVYIHAPLKNDDQGAYRIEVEKLKNTKITCNGMVEQKKSEKRQARLHEFGRAIAHPDAVMQILGYDQVYTDMEFVHIPTSPAEERPAYEHAKPIDKMIAQGLVVTANSRVLRPSDLHAPDIIPCHRARLDLLFPPRRRFTPSELTVLKDLALSPLSVDATCVYGIRPPELRSIMHQSVYLRCFKRSSLTKSDLPQANGGILDAQYQFCLEKMSLEYSSCTWIDGLHHVVLLKAKGLSEVVGYIQQQQLLGHTCPNDADLLALLQRAPGDQILNSFLCDEEEELPYLWYSSILPSTGHRFLIHLVLSFGRFSNEFELWRQFTSWPALLEWCGLLNPGNIESSINSLTRKYLMEQLRMIPGGTKTFDRHLCDAYETIKSAMTGSLVLEGGGVGPAPPILYTHMRLSVHKEVDEFIRERRDSIAKSAIQFLHTINTPNVPAAEEVVNARQLNCVQILTQQAAQIATGRWSMLNMGRPQQQSPASFLEQKGALRKISEILDSYQLGNRPVMPVLCITGPPGSGKTTCLRAAALDSLSRSLNVFVTAVPAQRALTLGGKHFHLTFGFPVNGTGNTSPARMAEVALAKLYRKPALFEYLRTCDVGFIDEWGQFSDVMMSFLDILLRRLCSSSSYMAGKVLICTYDPAQFCPIKARPAMLSPHVITNFRFVRLGQLVRSCEDDKLMRAIEISRMPRHLLTTEIIDEYKTLMVQECSFATSIEDPAIPRDAIFVFSHKKPVDEARNRILQKLRDHHGTDGTRTVYSSDEECLTEGHWQRASAVTASALDRRVKEMRRLDLFLNVMYEVTFNETNKFAQSQLAVLAHLPSQDELNHWKPVSILVAPFGFKEVVDESVDAHTLLSQGWRKCTIGTCRDRPQDIGHGLKARRQQYGLRPYIASTCHSIIGHTLSTVVSRVSATDSDFELWDRHMLVVLQSRTRRLKDLWWISTDPQETAQVLASVLHKQAQYDEYVDHLLEVLSESEPIQQHASSSSSSSSSASSDPDSPSEATAHPGSATIQQSLHPFRPMDVAFPMGNVSCCYLIMSLRDPGATYIGETNNLVERFRKHNRGIATLQTASRMLAPWAMYAFVVGFGDGSHLAHRKSFERQWQNARLRAHSQRVRNCQPSLTVLEIARLAETIMPYWPDYPLRLVLTGTADATVDATTGHQSGSLAS